MLWTLGASRGSGCSQILWMLADVRGCSGCSALLGMFGDALIVRRCSGCSPMLWTRQAARWSRRFCANVECLRPQTRSLPQSSRSLHRVQAEKQEQLRPTEPAAQRHSGNSNPARLHYGPKDFAWTLRALSGVLKASPGPPRPRFGASSGRNREEGLTLGTKQPETTP